ncbi:MAG: IS1 family transposase [Dehalococcoidia bacterium]
MNKLSIERQAQIIKVLCEGNSIRSTARITGTAINTIISLLQNVGLACMKYQDTHLVNLTTKRIECDEIWAFCHAKEQNLPPEIKDQFGQGDVWTFVALDADTKLVIGWLVGEREPGYAYEFLKDVKRRLANRVQLNTDGHRMYYQAIDGAFGDDIDYAIIVKHYGTPIDVPPGKYSPGTCRNVTKKVIKGHPDEKKISTSYVERQNLTMRTYIRRFTRLTNGFSKKIENHIFAIALHFMYYNFCKTHRTLANPYPRTPAMAAGLTDHIWPAEEIVRLT